MDKQAALNALGLSEGASAEAIGAALEAKRQDLAGKKASAPTDALKAKFAAIESKLAEVEKALAEAAVGQGAAGSLTNPAPSRPSLSQTKLADLPGLAPQDAAQVELQPGQTLANRYEIKELIGQGGMGAVYRAFDKNTDRGIALKLLLPSLLKHASAKERFLSEARISQQLSHPHIVNVFDVQSDGELYFLTMELLEGQDLRQWLDNLKAVNQPAPLDEVKRIAGELCDALAYAHEFTVHRDIKPENIWLDEKGRVKLMDFGIARVQSASQRTQTGAAMGTAYYMAPEQLQGRELDARADIYAVGVMLYEMLTGQIPAGRFEPAITLRKDIGKGLSQTIDKALSVNPEQRFASAAELKAALQSGKAGKVAKVSAPSTAAHFSQGPNKWAIAVVLFLIVGVGGAVGTGVIDLSGLMPMSKQEIAAQKAYLAKVQGEIKVLKQRLETARRNLDSNVRDAERNGGKELANLRGWQRQAEESIFSGSGITELEGDLAMAETLLGDNAFEQARPVFERVREGYAQLLQDFEAIPLVGRLVAIPGGSFEMGSEEGFDNEKPLHSVTIKAFRIMEHEVTFAQWDACVSAGGCSHKPGDGGWGRGNRPVINVSWNDITQQFIPWLNKAVGQKFRLPSEAEWEYAARAGSMTEYAWGDSISCSQARYGRHKRPHIRNKCSNSEDGTVPVKSFPANRWGLYDMHGNVEELVEDCWHTNYQGAPASGSVWLGWNLNDCSSRSVRGGSWFDNSGDLRSAYRSPSAVSSRISYRGFRLVRDR